MHKRMNSNPKRGHVHFRAPSKIVWRTIRGMLPHKTAHGQEALNRLKVFEGIPPLFDKSKRMVMPDALRSLRLAPGRRYTVLKDLSTAFGWKYEGIVTKLEDKRKVRSHERFCEPHEEGREEEFCHEE
eukprot:GABW01001349.1.p1 GENE.GABW01001349.1~~GABW01001349.1.p1  ORF type:complete len:128 (-),score=30.26 GABW01001349.1:41-424(-)